VKIRFKDLFSNSAHEVYTVGDMQWNGVKNGVLLQLLKDYNFNCWIVADKNIPYQQNISKLPCTVIVLDIFRNTLAHVTPLFADVLTVLKNVSENENRVIVSLSQELKFE
jgi:hypothetical protein